MAPKDAGTDKEKTPMLKGPAAEKAIRDYIRKCNRPYGAADISANLKNAVSKPNTQKILLALAEKDEITQKTYGKQTFFVAKQCDIEDVPPEKAAELEQELLECKERIKAITSSNKNLAAESTALRSQPPTNDLPALLTALGTAMQTFEAKLEPFRSMSTGSADTLVPTPEDMARVDAEWIKWRDQWKMRKKVFKETWSSITDSLPASAALDLAETLGIEFDSPEHGILEQGPLCRQPSRFIKRW
ncbi:TBPIP-domain-containing protein [Cantharellus anzutake]|uniref:TBPIP-domain-containing protein n=1 Tax=Cantharellus anzutake TaxID=1750568 RepID=UPI001905990D|nr:TBPIP-domain-containing protein [Cantharellus anzutake]KAF8339582.1 TBPIP-domain-containing protein [Cantharellus anzutake]